MWGWKTVEREVRPGVDLEQARQILEDAGFEWQSGDENHATFRRDGTQVTTEGEKMPVQLAVAHEREALQMQLRYDTFVLFDSGDLERYGDEIANWLSPATI